VTPLYRLPRDRDRLSVFTSARDYTTTCQAVNQNLLTALVLSEKTEAFGRVSSVDVDLVSVSGNDIL